jgi:hypothetical protein
MKKRKLVLIIAAVVLAHGGVFYLLKDLKPLPKRKFVSPPNFTMRQSQPIIAETGETLTYREYTVSTRLESRTFPE